MRRASKPGCLSGQGAPFFLQRHGARRRRRHCVSFSVTVKRTVALTHGPRARSGSGSIGKKHSWGCEPTCTIAYCPQPFWLKGPLEPPFGRTFTPDCALQRACKPLNIHHSEYPILESHSFLERVCCSTGSGQEHLRGLSLLEKEKIIIFDSRAYSTRPNTLLVQTLRITLRERGCHHY